MFQVNLLSNKYLDSDTSAVISEVLDYTHSPRSDEDVLQSFRESHLRQEAEKKSQSLDEDVKDHAKKRA